MKESVQDALSEFWQSCGGGSFINGTRPSQINTRDKTHNMPAENFQGSDDEQPQGDISQEESKDYDPNENRSTTQFIPYGDARLHRKNGGRVKSASFGDALRLPQQQIDQDRSINGSVIGDKSRAFFQANETMLAQSKREENRVKYKHCMDNVFETKSEMLCKKISFLFINDFNSAFTPVLELEMTGVNVEQNVVQADDVCQQMLKLHQMTGNYFNLELGEWEPFIENLALDISQNQTLSQKTIVVNFIGSVIINLTQPCLRNFSYTHEAWMSMPGLNDPEDVHQPVTAMKQKQDQNRLSLTERQTSKKMKLHMHATDSQSSYSINSGSSGEKNQTSKQDVSAYKNLESTFAPIREEESKMHDSVDLMASAEKLEEDEPEEVMEDNSGMQQITPFQIKNWTTWRISVYEGGAAQAQNHGTTYQSLGNSQMLQKVPQNNSLYTGLDRRTSLRTSQAGKAIYPATVGGRVFRIDKGDESNYSVSMADLLDRQQTTAQQLKKKRFPAQEKVQDFVDEDDLERGRLYHVSGSGFQHLPMTDENDNIIEAVDEEQENEFASERRSGVVQQQISFKNAVVVGIQLNAHDVIQNIDMNEISYQDPYVYWLTSRYMLERSLNFEAGQPSGSFNLDELNAADPLLGNQDEQQETKEGRDRMKYSQFLEKERNDEYGYYDQNIFYGVVLNKMQKQLVIRTPYVFYNRTLLNIEVVIRKTPQVESIFGSALKKPASEALNNEKVRFILEPEEKYPLDPIYYYGHSIKVRVFDQCTVAIEEQGHNQQMSIYKKAANMSTQQQNSSAAASVRSSLQQLTNNTNSVPQELSNQQLFIGRGFSKDVSIEGLTKLDLNHGPGFFIAGPESDSLCMSIKRQPGELCGTTDIVFLPTLSVKNVLPCDIKIKRQKRMTTQEQLQHRLQEQIEEKTYYLIQKSEQKDFYTFDGSGANGNEMELQIQVTGFLLSEKIVLNQRDEEERDLEIIDASNNSLTIGMKVQPSRAGYQVTFFAHACILLETLRLLNSNSLMLFYEAESIKQQIKRVGGRLRRQKLAGQDNIEKSRYVMCNKDQSIVLSVHEGNKHKEHQPESSMLTEARNASLAQSNNNIGMQQDYFGASEDSKAPQETSLLQNQSNTTGFLKSEREINYMSKEKHLFFSQGLNIKQAGELTDFAIRTETTEQTKTGNHRQQSKIQHILKKYDFQMNVALEMADFEEKIFTKVIVISPKYVLVNQMKGAIEVAQINTQHLPSGSTRMEHGDRREWVWNDYSKASLICVRKSGFDDEDSFIGSSSGDDKDSDEDEDVVHRRDDDKNQIMEESSRYFQRDDTSDEDIGSDSDDEKKKKGSYEQKDDLKAKRHKSARLLGDSSKDFANTTLKSLPGKKRSKRSKKNPDENNQLMQSSEKKSKFSKHKSWTTRSRKIRRKMISESGLTEADKVLEWEWSKGFSPEQNKQMTMAIMIREAENSPNINCSAFNDMQTHRAKVIRVTKKLMNNTVFVIFEDEHELFPMYQIINECRTIKVELRQYEMDEPKPTSETIDFGQKMIFGFYEPENYRKIQLDLHVDKNNVANPLQKSGFEYLDLTIIDLASQSSKHESTIPYVDSAGQQHEVILTVTNDGQTQTILLSVDSQEDDGNDRMLNERFKMSTVDQQQLAKQEDEDARKKLKKEVPNTLINVKLDELLVSFVAKVQKSRTEQLLIEENAELALFTWQKINFTKDVRAKEGKHSLKLSIGHFQIDNQSTWNPLFQQIFRTKRYHGARNSRRGGEEEQNINRFFNLEAEYRVDPEKPVTIVDRLVCTIAESCLCIESDFLVNWGYAAVQVRPYFENVDSYIHPLFTKNSICEIKDMEVEELNMCDTYVSSRNSSKVASVAIPGDGQKSSVSVMEFRIPAELPFEVADLEAPLLNNENYRLSEASARLSSDMDFLALTDARKDDHYRSRDQLSNQMVKKDLLTNVMGEILVNDKQCIHTVEDAPTHLRRWYQQSVTNTKETLYLREFLIDQVNLDLSFVVKTADSTNAGTAKNHYGPLQYLKMSGVNLINIDEARFRIARFGLQNYCIGTEDVKKQLSDFYGQSMIAEVRKMVGSVGLLGTPRTLFYSIGDGFHDFIAMPLDGFSESNILGATYGFAAGTMSLTKQIYLGVLMSFQQFFRDASQLILLASKDKDYMRRREDRMIIEKPQHFVDGFGYGANSFIQSLKSGLTGIVTRPYVEIRRRGFRRGAPSGMYQSLAGVAKPISGVFDLASKTAEGLKNTIRGFDVNTMKDRIRQPRTFYGIQRKIKKYCRNDALLVGEFLMQVGEGRFADNHFLETKLIRSTRQNAHLLMLTEEQLFLVEATQKELVWNIKTELIDQAQCRGNGIVIFLMQEYEGQENVSLEVDATSRHEIESWLNAIANEFN